MVSESVDLGVAMVQTASLLKSIPRARKAAIVESLRFLRTTSDIGNPNERLVSIFLDVVSGSPYFTDEQRADLTELVLQQNWQSISRHVGCNNGQLERAIQRNKKRTSQFKDFQKMVLLLFRTSRKFGGLAIDRKRHLGGSILACRTKEQLMDLFIRAISESMALDSNTRMLVANDVFEGQFHLLLLPDRLDCDERPRQYSVSPSAPSSFEDDEAEDECAICLECLSSDRISLEVCSHSFSRPCLEGRFATYHTQARHSTCPLCRQEASIPTLEENSTSSQDASISNNEATTDRRGRFSFRGRRRPE